MLALVGKSNKNFKSRRSTYTLQSLRFACAMTLWGTNYEQCFPVAVIKGEKVGQIDIIYVRGKFRQSTLGNSNWPQFSLLTHAWWAPVHQWWTTCLHFLNPKYFSDQRKFRVQDARITLLKTSNLEQRESRQQLEKKSAKYPLAIIYSRVKFWVGTMENFNQPQLSLLSHRVLKLGWN